jgi:hypothetical protein
MSEHGDVESVQQLPPFPEHVSAIFARLDASDVEQFYKSYSLWSLQQRIEILQIETTALQQAIADNDRLLQEVRPSTIALASLAQFQASGVNDVDLLDRMLERGEDWLDHTIQLLKHCEELDVIGSNYTRWCENALEGAYEWIESMNERESAATPVDTQPRADAATEQQLLEKLMSEEPVTVADNAPQDGVEDESADTIGSEDDNSPTLKRPALTGTQISEATAAPQTQQADETTIEEEAERMDSAEVAPEESSEVAHDGEEALVSSSVPTTISTQQEQQPPVRQGRHFLRRLLASVWHD